jgi:hypothetical protein
MSGSTENTAHDASEKPGRRDTALNLATTSKMLPLVQRIVGDVLESQRRLTQLLPEQEALDRQRRVLSWPQRARRYQVQEEVTALDRKIQEAVAELADLGLVLLDAEQGLVGFPTVVNKRRAYFSWRNGEEKVGYWQFPEETVRRPIPASWLRDADIALSANS